jgi:ParB-like chromosome segregation protein Spo0J
MFPLMEGDEFNNLVEDIEANGLVEGITVKDGQIVDGRNRYLACKTARYKFKKNDFVELPEDADVLAYIVSKNIQRRHLTAEGKRKVIAELLKANPDKSSRAIAFLVRCSHHTVEGVRQEMADATGQSAQTDQRASGQSAHTPPTPPQTPRIGRDGRRRQLTLRLRPAKPPTHKELIKQVDDFKAAWDKLNPWQRRYFVKSRGDEITATLDEINHWQGEQPAQDAEQQVEDPAAAQDVIEPAQQAQN